MWIFDPKLRNMAYVLSLSVFVAFKRSVSYHFIYVAIVTNQIRRSNKIRLVGRDYSHSIDSLYPTESVNVCVPSERKQFRHKIARGW